MKKLKPSTTALAFLLSGVVGFYALGIYGLISGKGMAAVAAFYWLAFVSATYSLVSAITR